MTLPSEILLLRHGEETADETDADLSAAGRVRADKLAQYLPATFGTPDVLIAAAAKRTSMRAFLTIRPLSLALATPIFVSVRATQPLMLAARMFADEAYENKRIVICWTHTELPSLAKALKARRGDFPRQWDDTLFDLILHLDYRHGARPRTTAVRQPF